MRWRVWVVGLLLAGCAGELPPPTEQEVHAALARDFLQPMGDVLVAGASSDCRTDGVTDAPVPAILFAAFLDANEPGEPPDLAGSAVRLRLDTSGRHPRRISAERAEPVVAVSRAGLADASALVCVEVFGVQERAFFVLLDRAETGVWSVRTELKVWSELPPEELPDGELYR